MNIIHDILGEVCKVVLPIPQESYRGNPESSIAVCTLCDIKLLKKLAVPNVLQHVNIIGRLLSENKGIDAILKFLYENPHIHTVIICGTDGHGHYPGHSLVCLHKYGVCNDQRNTNRISNSHSPDPYLRATVKQIKHFSQNVSLVDKTGVSDYNKIIKCITNITD